MVRLTVNEIRSAVQAAFDETAEKYILNTKKKNRSAAGDNTVDGADDDDDTINIDVDVMQNLVIDKIILINQHVGRENENDL